MTPRPSRPTLARCATLGQSGLCVEAGGKVEGEARLKIKGRPGSTAGRRGGCRADSRERSVPFSRAGFDLPQNSLPARLRNELQKSFSQLLRGNIALVLQSNIDGCWS